MLRRIALAVAHTPMKRWLQRLRSPGLHYGLAKLNSNGKECQMLQGLSQQLIAKRITTSCRPAAGWLYWKVMSDLGLNC